MCASTHHHACEHMDSRTHSSQTHIQHSRIYVFDIFSAPFRIYSGHHMGKRGEVRTHQPTHNHGGVRRPTFGVKFGFQKLYMPKKRKASPKIEENPPPGVPAWSNPPPKASKRTHPPNLPRGHQTYKKVLKAPDTVPVPTRHLT